MPRVEDTIDPDRLAEFLGFVVERHRVWERRQSGQTPPWTEDPVLSTRKFTNIFRVLDYGSQFLVRELLDDNLPPRDILMRCFLYRFTNLPATWIYIREQLGRYPLADDLGPQLVSIIHDWRAKGEKVFSGAYVILPQPNCPGDKVAQAVELARSIFNPASDTVIDFLLADTQRQRLDVLRRPYGVGDFMAMQILTDWGYSAQCGEDRENEFVVPGPGARKGAQALNPKAHPEQTLSWAFQVVRDLPDCPTLPSGRPPSLMDVQNCFCEFSKYVRGPVSTPYKAVHPGPQPIALPTHWKDTT